MANTIADQALLIARMARVIDAIHPATMMRIPGPIAKELRDVVELAQPFLARGVNQPRQASTPEPDQAPHSWTPSAAGSDINDEDLENA